MILKDYQEQANRTCPNLGWDGDINKDHLHMKLGVITEVAEIIEIFKRHLAYGKDIDLVNLSEECADVSWYIANDATFCGIVLDNTLSNSPQYTSNYDIIDDLIKLKEHFCHNYIAYHVGLLKTLKGICDFYKVDYFQSLENNIAKLKVRYPDKFSKELALNRDLKSERMVLEKK